MVRLAGFLAGSAIAIALILLVLGMPELRAPDAPPEALIAVTPAPPPAPEPAPEPAAKEAPEPQAGSKTIAEAVPEPEAASPAPPAVHWHNFWSPFGSRIAADGFISRLEAVTGFDYRVVRIDNGVYEVAFAYSDDSEREAMLAAIAAATGLDLPDS